MRKLLLAAVALAMATAAARAQDTLVFVTVLTGHQQVPSVASLGEHLVFVEFVGNQMTVSTGNPATLSSPINEDIGAHIHLGFTGENGPIVLPLAYQNLGSTGRFYASATLTDTTYMLRTSLRDSLVTAIGEGRAYINVHTLQFPAGEIRGQLIPDGDADVYDAMLYGDQENPGVLTDGMGGVMIELVNNTVTVSGAFRLDNPLQPVGGTGAHLHLGLVGENGPIAFPLTPVMAGDNLSGVFRRADNVFTFTDEQLDTLDARNMYVNIHSVAHPAGEIRGQVVGFNSNLYFSHVSYDNPTPFPNPRARMKLMAEKPIFTNGIFFSGTYAGWGTELDDRQLRPFLQIGNPYGGAALTVLTVAVRPGAEPGVGRIPFFGRAATAVQLEGLYLRYSPRAGYLLPTNFVAFDSDFYHECKRAFYSSITPSQEVDATVSRGLGEAITEYYTSRVEINGFVANTTDTISAAHIHDGMAGENGPVVAPIDFFPLNAAAPFTAILPTFANINLTDEQAATMRERGFYLNFHTSTYPGGEVRGQIAPRANTLYHTIIEPQQAFPGGGPTDADGALLVEADQNRMVATGSFRDLNGFNPAVAGGAHLHVGLPGVNGPIRYPLTTAAPAGASEGAFLPADNTFMGVTSDALDSLTNRLLYANIHSLAVPSGEIRGQVGPLATNVVASRLSTDVTIPYTGRMGMSRGTGRLVAEVYDTTVVVSGAFSRLSSPIDVSIAGGAHMHAGTVGVAGGILFPIRFTPESGDTNVMVMPRMNVTPVTPANRMTLLNGDIYANVHTEDAPTGAIRGQMLLSENRYPDATSGFSSPANGATLDLGSGDLSTVATIDWADSEDRDEEQDIAYIWQLFADTSAAPVVQTMASATSATTFTFGRLDTMLADLGVAEGASATVFHRAWTTDGSLLTPSDYAAVTLVRRMQVDVRELPAGAARLVNNAGARGTHTMFLDVADLPAGRYTYAITNAAGQRLQRVAIDHSGAPQRYAITDLPDAGGMYFLNLSDNAGRSSGWGFIVQ